MFQFPLIHTNECPLSPHTRQGEVQGEGGRRRSERGRGWEAKEGGGKGETVRGVEGGKGGVRDR